MTNIRKDAYEARDAILKMLSDNEAASVSTAETAASLEADDEYLDLEHLDRGVQRAGTATITMGHVLPKKAVRAMTWDDILKHLPKAHRVTAQVPPQLMD